jgi:chemotaxis protein CheD
MNSQTANADAGNSGGNGDGAASLGDHLASNRYYDRSFDAEAVKLLPGEYFATTENLALVTVLGSCVSACIVDREKGIGGMNHFMLAQSDDGKTLSGASARYGTFAMEILINHLYKLGARRSSLTAKVFGGGRVMASLVSSRVGEQNARFVIDYLKTEGIPIVAQDLLDVYPRKIYFFPASGRVLVKKLVRQHNETLERREREYAARLTEAPPAGDIELFT